MISEESLRLMVQLLEERGYLVVPPDAPDSYRLLRMKDGDFYAAATFTQEDLEQATEGHVRKLTPEELERVAEEVQDLLVNDDYWEALDQAACDLGFVEGVPGDSDDGPDDEGGDNVFDPSEPPTDGGCYDAPSAWEEERAIAAARGQI